MHVQPQRPNPQHRPQQQQQQNALQLLQQMQIRPPTSNNINITSKMDNLFYNSITKSTTSYIYRIALHFVKLVLLVVFLPIDVLVLHSDRTLLIAFMGVAIGLILYNICVTIGIVKLGYGENIKNNQLFVLLAHKYSHSVPEEPLERGENFQKLANCVSPTIYNVASGALNNDQGLTPQIKSRYQGVYTNLVSVEVFQSHYCLNFFQRNGKFGSFAIIIFGIVALSLSQASGAQIGVIVVYLVLEALNVWIVILGLFILCLSPLIIIGVCVFCCCCMKQPGQVDVPDSVDATAQIIEQTDGSCPICFQNFKLSQKVVILRCSNKHVFHDNCLSGWLRMSHTCPMCRKDINQPAAN